MEHSFSDASFVSDKPADIDAIDGVKFTGGIHSHNITQTRRCAASNIERDAGFFCFSSKRESGLRAFDIVIEVEIWNFSCDTCLDDRMGSFGIRPRSQNNESSTADQLGKGGFIK